MFFRALQGMSAGAGIVVSRAVIRDMFPPADAQRVMSQVTIYFGVAPAVAPMVGGFLFVHADWHSIFWFLTAVGVVLWVANYAAAARDAAPAAQRQPFNVRNLMRGYWQMGSSPRFMMLALASGIPFNGMFLYVLSAPVFLGEHLHLAPGAVLLVLLPHHRRHHGRRLAVSGRLAGRIKPQHQIRHGFLIMLVVSLVNLVLNLLFDAAGLVGAAAARHLRLRLGADGAGGHADGARPGARAARHGVVAAGLHRQPGQRPGRRRDRAAGDALDGRRWRSPRC